MQAAGGINRYFARIINNLPDDYAPVLTVNNLGKIDCPGHSNLRVFKCERFRPHRISTRVGKHFFRFVSRGKYDLVHPTYYALLSTREIAEFRAPVVITVWDMIHELFAAQMDANGEVAEMKRRAIEAATAIICISENTKQDLLKFHPTSEHKISVTHLAPGIDASMSHGAEVIPSRPYFIHVGSRSAGYKNFDRLLSAFADVVRENNDVALCISGAAFDLLEKRLINELNLSNNIEHYGHVTDAHLAKLYRHSIALVYPSLYEGFGIPPLEAMACGTAVIASGCSSIPEVVGDAGLLFNPRATDELTEAMFYLLNSPAKRGDLIDKGKHRIEMFSWKKTAAQTVDVYRHAASMKGQIETG